VLKRHVKYRWNYMQLGRLRAPERRIFGMQDRVPPFPTEDALLVMQNGALLA